MDAKEKLPNAIELHRRLNQLKKTDLPWLYESSKCCGQEALRNLDKGFDNFFRKCKLKKIGKWKGKVGFPRFKSKKKGIGSFRLTGTIKVESNKVFLPNLKWLRLKEHGYLPIDAKVLSATVSEYGGRWFVALQVEQEIADHAPKAKSVVGIDLGIKMLATCSDGITYENPKPLRTRLKKLKRLSRAVSKKKMGSQNRKKVARRVAKLHYRISNIRKDTLNKMTTTLTKTKSACVIEDLNVSGMLKNRCLSQAISEIGFGEFKRQMEYKGKLYGCEIVMADRFFPTSRLCGKCGSVNEKLTLADRTWTLWRDPRQRHERRHQFRKLVASSANRINACGEVGSGVGVSHRETDFDETVIQQKSYL